MSQVNSRKAKDSTGLSTMKSWQISFWPFGCGSIGFDDWEWGVDLFADDPLVFKKLIYEMRFDQVSAVYALFGTFYIGLRCPAARLGELLSGTLPRHE